MLGGPCPPLTKREILKTLAVRLYFVGRGRPDGRRFAVLNVDEPCACGALGAGCSSLLPKYVDLVAGALRPAPLFIYTSSRRVEGRPSNLNRYATRYKSRLACLMVADPAPVGFLKAKKKTKTHS